MGKGVKSAFSYWQEIDDEIDDGHGQTATHRIPRGVLPCHEPWSISP